LNSDTSWINTQVGPAPFPVERAQSPTINTDSESPRLLDGARAGPGFSQMKAANNPSPAIGFADLGVNEDAAEPVAETGRASTRHSRPAHGSLPMA
jgi:hypothetical protein